MNTKSLFSIFGLLFIMGSVQTFAQSTADKYFTKEGHISFHSETPMETIEADNHKATSVLDVNSGKMEFALLVKAFGFEKALMQEHFNENYMESDDYPKATFKGAIRNIDEVNFSEAGTYTTQGLSV